MSKPDENRDWLKIQDRLDDLLAGLEFWKKQKVGSGELTTLDEMLIRWVEASPAAER